ncbi:hypothetical protein [Paenibacillus camerounensis]|uniref:hypothetical protein n=1 Tax=Paenibacillus camerounensis TaxID=1243663 RepID=UPI0005A94214|nr:hypothetical protein [Paenibacillus camerounensis]
MRIKDHAVQIFVRYDEILDKADVTARMCHMPDWGRLRAVQRDNVRFIAGTVNYDDAYNSQQLLSQFADLW